MQFFKFFFILIIFVKPLNANEAKNWLNKEINNIISAYQNQDLPNENKFLIIEQTINTNFATVIESEL